MIHTWNWACLPRVIICTTCVERTAGLCSREVEFRKFTLKFPGIGYPWDRLERNRDTQLDSVMCQANLPEYSWQAAYAATIGWGDSIFSSSMLWTWAEQGRRVSELFERQDIVPMHNHPIHETSTTWREKRTIKQVHKVWHRQLAVVPSSAHRNFPSCVHRLY